MATNFSPCKGSYVLNQFPSNVMFGMNGFHVSASGAIQGHHGPLVFFATIVSLSLSHINVHISIVTKVETDHIEQFLQIFYGVILALSCNKREPSPPPPFFQSP